MGAHPTILLVEDTPDLLHMLQQLLTSAGYVVMTASSGAAAFPILTTQHQSVSVFICDRTLPDADGIELARLARDLNPRMHVLLITGAAGTGALEEPGITVLVKPFPGRLLLEQLQELFANA